MGAEEDDHKRELLNEIMCSPTIIQDRNRCLIMMKHTLITLIILISGFSVCMADEDPEQAAIWFDKGKELESMSNYEQAISAYDMSLKFKPNVEEVLLEKGSALARLDRYNEAVRAFDKALELKPDDIDAWTQKGDALNWLAKDSEALKAYDKVLELDPKNSYAALKKKLILNQRTNN